jgi:hypothetical protein
MIRARPRHQLSIEALDAGRAGQKPDQDFAEDCGMAGARGQRAYGFRREDDGLEEQEELWQVGHVTA